jgi:hypothetical protein
MKRLVLAALAIGAMAACTKSNVQLEQPGEISLQPVAQKATKAAVDGTYYPTDAAYNFNVWAWWGNHNAGTELNDFTSEVTPYIAEGEFVNRNNNSWGGKTPYYWPTKGSLVFAGYSPATASCAEGEGNGFSYVLANKKFKATGYVQSNVIASAVDLMWFDATDKSYNQNGTTGGVPVVFKHALSWLTFKFNLASNKTAGLWTITKVELNGIKDKANFTAFKGGTAIWEDWDKSAVDKVLTSTLYNNTETPYLIKYAENGTVLPGTDIVTEGSNVRTNAALVIPQPCADAELVITYNLKTYVGEGVLSGQTVSLPLTGTPITDNMWLPGKHYIYTITFGGNEILIAPSVTDWTDETVENIPVQ